MNNARHQVTERPLRTFTAEDHITQAETFIEKAEEQTHAPAAIVCYEAATAHATLAIAKATLGRS